MNLYEEITNRIIDQLEKGIIPWQKPWTSGSRNGAYSHVTGKPYSTLNQMLLQKPGEYITFNQCRQEGGYVRKGEKASHVVFWKVLETTDTDDTGEEDKKMIPMLKTFAVFHIDQCEGIKRKYEVASPVHADPDESAEEILQGYISRSRVSLTASQGDKAFYRPSTDSITLPLMEQFKQTAEYYSTAFHEAIHSTGHKSRLNRLSATAHFGNDEYSKEELVAEIGAATLLNMVGLETRSSFRNSVAYIQNWLSVLRNDTRMIVFAASRADKAVQMITGQQ